MCTLKSNVTTILFLYSTICPNISDAFSSKTIFLEYRLAGELKPTSNPRSEGEVGNPTDDGLEGTTREDKTRNRGAVF